MRLRCLSTLLLAIPVLVAVAALKAPGTSAAQPPASPAGGPILGLDGKPDTLPDAAFVETVQKQCSKCHVPPQPQYLPRGMWRLRIQEMAQRSLMGTGVTPGEESVLWQMDTAQFVRYFEARSPATLPLPEPWPAGESGLRLEKRTMAPAGAATVPVVANTRFFDLDGDGELEIVACDMGHGVVYLGDPNRGDGALRVIAKIPNPDHAEMLDLDKDGKQDLLIADLGDFMPGDHEKGSIVWLRQTTPLEFEAIPLVTGIARTADVQAGDFDGDGKLDLAVAAFGWHTVGGIWVYENRTTDWKSPQFEGYPVDARPGGIHVPIVDLNGDGRLDFVALISQQYEHVVAFINRGPGRGFRPETVFRAVVPVWGSSGIQLVDMDGDGDMDVVAAAFLPNAEHPAFQLLERQGNLAPFTSLGWLEQTRPGVFVPRAIETGKLTHTTLDLGDFDGDGDVDIVTGNFVGFTFTKADTGFKADTAVDLWVNRARP
jgi:hypothetical protein